MTPLVLNRKHPAGFFENTVDQVSLPPVGFKIIDVREPHEFTGELGHIPGAQLMPMASTLAHLASWNKDETLLIVCKSGGRSGSIAQALVNAGFKNVSNMVGGMMAWNSAARPVEK
jgi:rhodanese-related sulfurtransferase